MSHQSAVSVVSRSRTILRFAALAAVLCVPGVHAQAACFQIPDAKPTKPNVIGLGSWKTSLSTFGSQRYQLLVLPKEVKSKLGLICSLGFAPGGTGIRHFDSLVIKMGYLPPKVTRLGTTFAKNLTSAKTVLDVKSHDWHHSASTGTTLAFAPIGLQVPFLYVPTKGPLVIDITITGAFFSGSTSAGFHTGTKQRLFAFQWAKKTPPTTGIRGSSGALKVELCYQSAKTGVYGSGCAGSGGKIPSLKFKDLPRLNKSFKMEISGGLPNANQFVVFGLRRPQTPALLPGTKACYLYPTTDVILVSKLNAVGSHTMTFLVPKDAPVCASVYAQAFPWDKTANSFGTSATPYGRILIGL